VKPLFGQLDSKMETLLLILGLFSALAFGQAQEQATAGPRDYSPYPAPAPGYVTDLAGVITQQDKDYLNHMIYQTEKKTGVEMVVLTINSIRDYPTGTYNIEGFAAGLFNKWGIGNLPKNDGVLLLVAVKDRKARIELGGGYGRSRDADAQRIMNRIMVPYFKKNQFSAGIKKGGTGLASEFAHCRWTFAWSVVVITLLIVVAVFVAISLFRSGRRGWGWVVVGIITILVLALLRILGRLAHEMAESRSGLGSPGGFGGGFGGGFSGGGGATGSW
jgi:uncharacterized protein